MEKNCGWLANPGTYLAWYWASVFHHISSSNIKQHWEISRGREAIAWRRRKTLKLPQIAMDDIKWVKFCFCLFMGCYQIFPTYIRRLVISAMQFQIKSSLWRILFQPNLTQLFRFWKWNKKWSKMRTKDQTLETDQSFLCNRSVIISFENRSEIAFENKVLFCFGVWNTE